MMIAIALHSPARLSIPDDLTGKARKRARERRRTKERYPANWPKVSLIIRKLAGGKCERCGKPCGIRHLTTHHLGAKLATGEGWRPGNPHDKHDIRRENLQALCQSCHTIAELSSPLLKHRQLNIGTGLVLFSPPIAQTERSQQLMTPSPFTIALGSQSIIKQTAVQQALAHLGIEARLIAVKARSDVNEQPFDEETMRSAMNRVEHTARLAPHANICIAIESGLFRRDGRFLDIALIVMRLPDDRIFTIESQGVAFPENAVTEVCRRGADTWRIGKILAEWGMVAQHDDPHLSLVGKSRSGFIFDALVCLLQRFLDEQARCEACGRFFNISTGYYEQGEYAYCGDCCHW